MKKFNLFIISGIGASLLFLILTFIQGKIVNNSPTKTVFIAINDIESEEKITDKSFREVKVPLSLVNETNAVFNKEDIINKYAVSDIFKGEILFQGNLASKEELKIVDAQSGVERIAINIRAGENAVAYQLKPKDRIHLYFTGRTGVIRDSFKHYGLEFIDLEDDNSMQTVKLIENVEILGIYDEFGLSCENSSSKKPDTVILGVSKDTAKIINNLREQGVFDITR